MLETKKEELVPAKLDSFASLAKDSDPLDNWQRSSPTFSDDLTVYKAKIYKCLGPFDDRLQVLPLVLMAIEPEEYKNLPRFPAFQKGQVITGRSIDEFDIEQADSVWCIGTPDFQTGYVLGRCNNFGDNTDQKWPYSYNFNSVKDFLYGRGAVPEDFDYRHFDIRYMVMTSKGGMIEMINHQTGDWVLFNTSGSIVTVQQKKVYIRTGSPPDPPHSGPAAFTALTMTPDTFHVKSPNITLDGRKVTLGHHNMNVLACGGGVLLGKNGTNAQVIENVFI